MSRSLLLHLVSSGLVFVACDRGEPAPDPKSAAAPPVHPEGEIAAPGEPSGSSDGDAAPAHAPDTKVGAEPGLAGMAAAYKDASLAGGDDGSTGAALDGEVDEPPLSGSLPPLPTGTLAEVGKTKISMSAFRAIYDLKVDKYAARGRQIPASADRRYRKSIAERLVYHELVRQEAARLGVSYDVRELAEREAQQRRGIRDWAKHLERRGETEESLRELYVSELLERAILEKEGALAITAAEVDADYESIKGNWDSDKPRARASHILVPLGPKGLAAPEGAPEPTAAEKAAWEAESKARAEAIHRDVTKPGADFGAVARAESSGPSASKGGDIGIFTAERMADEFSEAAFALSVGGISKPVKTKFGWHIIKLTGKWPKGVLPKEALEDQIVDRLKQRALHQGRRELKERLFAGTKVVDHMAATLTPVGG